MDVFFGDGCVALPSRCFATFVAEHDTIRERSKELILNPGENGIGSTPPVQQVTSQQNSHLGGGGGRWGWAGVGGRCTAIYRCVVAMECVSP